MKVKAKIDLRCRLTLEPSDQMEAGALANLFENSTPRWAAHTFSDMGTHKETSAVEITFEPKGSEKT